MLSFYQISIYIYLSIHVRRTRGRSPSSHMTNRLRGDQRGSPDGAHRTLHTEHKTGGTQSVVVDIRDLGSAPCPRRGNQPAWRGTNRSR